MDNTSKRKPKGAIKFSITLDDEQKAAKEKILTHPISFITGRAGTGKTLVAVQVALDLFFNRQIEKIVITRPTVSSEDNGFIPGSITEKLEPWMEPIKDNMNKVYNYPEKLEEMRTKKQIELVALTHFRGRTFDNAVCIVDEFQNLTEKQLEMCLGRLGKDSLMIFCGDLDQIDLQSKYKSVPDLLEALGSSQHVCCIKLKNNHRHPVLDEIFNLIEKFKSNGIKR